MRRKKRDVAMVLLVISMVAGVVSGILRPYFFSEADLAQLVANLHHFVTNFDASALGLGAVAESLLRYGRMLVLIWACAAVSRVRYAAFLVLYLRAMTLGFSAAMMVEAFGGRGFVMAMGLYAIQNAIIMPVYGYTACFIAKNRLEATRPVIYTAIAGVTAVVTVAAIEVYMAPRLFEMLL
ncbi:MAG: hypothetical protein FWC93_05310 [Defluviitaleaceae bacterium]|nr:hypothetical protein [Defluviitaleaceae bacterium]